MMSPHHCHLPLLNETMLTAALNRSIEYTSASSTLAKMFNDGAYSVLSYTLMALGVFGNGLCLIILFKGSSLQTPHFYFYKVLTAAELLYCVTFFVSNIVLHFGMTTTSFIRIYKTVHGLHFVEIVARFIYSSAGFVVVYMALIISVDRFTAIWLSTSYRRVTPNRKLYIGRVYSCVAVGLATIFHSWDAFSQYRVEEEEFYNRTFYRSTKRTSPDAYRTLKTIKDVYNFVIHLAYPVVLLALTVGVIVGLMRHTAHRMSIVSTTTSHNRRRLSERRRERHLFYLMGAVVAMAFVQAIPVEIKRVAFKISMKENLYQCIGAANAGLLPYSKANYILVMMAVQPWLFTVANLATMTDRSLKFYLYVILNDQFRTETIAVLCKGTNATGNGRRDSSLPRRNSMSLLSSFRSARGSGRRVPMTPEPNSNLHTCVAQRMSVA